jgi:hypothetical protein
MKSYQPQLKVTLIKARRRDEIAPGVPAIQSRYSQLDGVDLTPLLGDGSVVQTTKSTRQPMGGFMLRFADQPHPDFLETIYALIEPMDMIEIRMTRDISAAKDRKIPLVMRGFVSTISRPEVMAGDKPQRSVVVTGHDFAKVLQIYRISYMMFTEMGETAMSEFRFFQTFAPNAVKKNMTGNEFVNLVVNSIVNPYMANIAALTKADSLGTPAINQWQAKSSIEGAISAFAVSSFSDESLYNILRTVLDVGAFNELFLEDTEEAPVLVVRPIPFKDVAGNFIQGSADDIDVHSDEIISYQPSRSDEGVANYFWVGSNRMAMLNNQDQQANAIHGALDSFVKFGYMNSNKDVYGIRKMEVETLMGDELLSDSDSLKSDDLAKETGYLLTWQEKRRKLLADLNQDNVVFEQGSMRLRGNELVKAGMYLNLYRGINQSYVGEVYAHSVTQEFVPFHGYFTNVQFDRGTGFIARAQFPVSPYLAEIEAQGVK